MSEIVLLDAGPLGMISNPSATPANLECYNWMESLLMSGYQIIVPEIADYEVRRELLRADKTRGLDRLDFLKNTHEASVVFALMCVADFPILSEITCKMPYAANGRGANNFRF